MWACIVSISTNIWPPFVLIIPNSKKSINQYTRPSVSQSNDFIWVKNTNTQFLCPWSFLRPRLAVSTSLICHPYTFQPSSRRLWFPCSNASLPLAVIALGMKLVYASLRKVPFFHQQSESVLISERSLTAFAIVLWTFRFTLTFCLRFCRASDLWEWLGRQLPSKLQRRWLWRWERLQAPALSLFLAPKCSSR